MPDLWRISNHPDLTGAGGLRYGARWHTAGRRIVYLAESPAGALLEMLVHLELPVDDVPPGYTLLRISVPDDLLAAQVTPPTVPDWRTDLSVTQRLGDTWLRQGDGVLLRVPSVILPHTWNVLLNPSHPESARCSITDVLHSRFDPRLFRGGLRI